MTGPSAPGGDPAGESPAGATATGARPAPAAGRWTSKRAVVLLGLLAAGLAGVAAAQPWGSGHTSADVVGLRTVTGTGGELAPLVPALALVGGAAAVAAASTGRAARRVAIGAMFVAGLAVVGATLLLLHGLAAALGDRAAHLAASSTRIPVTATATFWPWVAVAAGVLLALAAALASAGLPSWSTPSRRYERPGEAPDRELTLWEQVGEERDVEPGAGPRDGDRARRDEVDTRHERPRPDSGRKS